MRVVIVFIVGFTCGIVFYTHRESVISPIIKLLETEQKLEDESTSLVPPYKEKKQLQKSETTFSREKKTKEQVKVIPPTEDITKAMEIGILTRINKERTNHGLFSFPLNPALANVARSYSKRMSTESFFNHISPDGKAFADRLNNNDIEWSLCGECIFMMSGYDPWNDFELLIVKCVEGWMNSKGHREILLQKSLKEAGVGVYIRQEESSSYLIHITFNAIALRY